MIGNIRSRYDRRRWIIAGRLARTMLAFLLMASTAPHAYGQTAPRGAAPMLAPGDMVRIEVWRRPELSGEFAILGTGVIGHPLYKDISVTGVPLETAEALLATFLRTLEANPQFVFEAQLRVAVAGEVRSPNLYHFPPQTTIADAVARAGGPTENAKIDDVRLYRGGREERLDLRAADRLSVGLLIRSGDEIVVQRKSGFSFLRNVFVPLATTATLVVSIIRVSNE